ncbi:MFS transporter [Roseibacterium beibuensis]|uniref:MFS transporter n=1 Tax=[Roseibacterium] beibuensis TaxID=1193142 RepID=A0ABP9L7C9_9RHOB|nr:MFS transporter [Roseibacterium beibuensis]MCS6624010.1 MFS transporter [Roseibacterium beibuensis]
MLSVLSHPVFARLFAAQIIALIGTGLMTVALGLLAYDLAGDSAGAVLGTALTIKMVAYVGLSPITNALVERASRKAVLIGADLLRAAIVLALPFVTQIWQVYALVFALQAASATFTPAFQATIPDILPDEGDYTRALSLSRLAYELENLVSPALAGLLLTLVSFHWLFAGTALGFVGSAMLVRIAAVPPRGAARARPFLDRVTRGVRIYVRTPRLRGLWMLNFAAASAGAFVIVNTVVLVRAEYGGAESAVAIALAAFGGGSMLAALGLPRLLDHVPDRPVMLGAAFALSMASVGYALYWLRADLPEWPVMLAVWLLFGMLYAAILTPSGRLLRRSVHPEDLPAIFTAQFALSHAGWLVTYPMAGWIGDALGLPQAMLALGICATFASLAALRLWPAGDPRSVDHAHDDLPPDHPHLDRHPLQNGRHAHAYVIDDMHHRWPRPGA